MTGSSPESAALCSGVDPVEDCLLGKAPAAMRAVTASAEFAAAALCSCKEGEISTIVAGESKRDGRGAEEK